jgi:hypothetical protein
MGSVLKFVLGLLFFLAMSNLIGFTSAAAQWYGRDDYFDYVPREVIITYS